MICDIVCVSSLDMICDIVCVSSLDMICDIVCVIMLCKLQVVASWLQRAYINCTVV